MQVLPFLLRRMKEDVLSDLPPKIIQDYYCTLTPVQKDLYDKFSETVEAAHLQSTDVHVFQSLQYLRKVRFQLPISPSRPGTAIFISKSCEI